MNVLKGFVSLSWFSAFNFLSLLLGASYLVKIGKGSHAIPVYFASFFFACCFVGFNLFLCFSMKNNNKNMKNPRKNRKYVKQPATEEKL